LIGLIVVISLTYAYWHFTNDRRVTRVTERHLAQALGGKVRVDHARLNIFGPVEVRGVRLWLPEDPDVPADAAPADPYFQARLIQVRHNPWSLLAGRFEPTDIYCDSATLTIHRDETTGEIDLQRLLPLLQQKDGDGEPFTLPSVTVRTCSLRMVKVQGQLRQTLLWRVGLTMGYHAPDVYRVLWNTTDDAERSQHQGIDIDLASGQLTPMGAIDIEQTAVLLPPKYYDWVRRYDIKGEIRLGAYDATGAATTSPANDEFGCELADVSIQFPPEEGGLTVHRVFGTLRMSRDGIEFQNVRGRLKQAGDAEFTLTGRYDGFRADSAFQAALTVTDLALPDHTDVGGPLAGALEWIDDHFKLRDGGFDIAATVRRDADGTLDYHASAKPKGMSMTLDWFPLPVTDVTGDITLDTAGAHIRNMTGRQGPTTLKISGDVHQLVYNAPLRITVETPDVHATDALGRAADHVARGVWEALSPSGQAGVKVNVVRLVRDGPMTVDVDLKLDGRLAMTYSGFRYPLEELTGLVHIHNDDATINRVTAKHGKARFRLDGKLMSLAHHDTQQIDLAVEASDLPLDDTLADAIDSAQSVWLGRDASVSPSSGDEQPVSTAQAVQSDPRGQDALATRGRDARDTVPPTGAGHAMFASLGLRGTVERLTGRVTKSADGPMGYDLHADLANARMKPEGFPYELTDAKARVRITPEKIEFQQFVARHGPARISGAAYALPRSSPSGLWLHVHARDLELGEDLLAALPADSAALVRKFSPKGSADVELRYNAHVPQTPDGYAVTIRPRGIDITFAEFPYTFRNVTGELVATPDEIKIQPLHAKMDQAQAELRGTVRFHGERVEVDLTSVKAENFPLDEALLAAAPADFNTVTRHLSPGGTCTVALTKLSLLREPAPPATSAPTDESSAPADALRVTWACQGSATFHQAVVNLGEDPQPITGTFTGDASSTTEGFAFHAEVAVESLMVGPRQLTDIHGRIVKPPQRDVIRFEQLAAKLYDGLAAGEAELKLTDPLQYAVRIEFDNVDLDQLVNAGAKETDRVNVVGRLGGSATYTMRPPDKNKPAAREAAGSFQITKAKIGKLPIMLDMLNFLYLSLPGDSAFTQGHMTYHLKGDTLVLSDIRFTGTGLSIIGSGTLAMRTERLNLTFLTAPPNKLPDLGLLRDVIESISREVSEVRVTGTLAHPKIATRSLQSVDEVLKLLVSPESRN